MPELRGRGAVGAPALCSWDSRGRDGRSEPRLRLKPGRAGDLRAPHGRGCGKRWGADEKAEPGAGAGAAWAGGAWSSSGGDGSRNCQILLFSRRRSYRGNTQNVEFAMDGNSAWSPVLGVAHPKFLCGPKFLVRVQVMATLNSIINIQR